jgi:hypothetical protein
VAEPPVQTKIYRYLSNASDLFTSAGWKEFGCIFEHSWARMTKDHRWTPAPLQERLREICRKKE